jgi:ATP-dependent Clp protease ATP-binding subunit ClpC
MQLATCEAQRFNHEFIGTEHLLLGLIRGGAGVAATVLHEAGVDLRLVRISVERLIESGPDMVTMGRLPQTPAAKRVIEYAIEEAGHLGHDYVGTEHLLLALLREQGGIAAGVLTDLGLRIDDIRAKVIHVARRPPSE